MRKILPFIMAACLICSLAGCMSGGNESSVVSEASRTPSSVPESHASPSPDISSEENLPENPFAPFRDALTGVYGDSYAPNRQLTEDEILSEIGLDKALYDDIYAENVSGGNSPDTFIAVKAKEGQTAQIEEKLRAYRDKLSQDAVFSDYADQIGNAQIFTEGDYVFFLLIGNSGVTTESDSSEGMAEAIGNDIQKGIDAIKGAIGIR